MATGCDRGVATGVGPAFGIATRALASSSKAAAVAGGTSRLGGLSLACPPTLLTRDGFDAEAGSAAKATLKSSQEGAK